MVTLVSRPVWDEIHPLWLGHADTPPVVTAVSFYFDDSHRLDGAGRAGVLAIAGYGAPLEVWEDFQHRWMAVIANAPREISEFASADCSNAKDEFADWTESERIEITKELLSIICSREYNGRFAGIGCAIEVPHVKDSQLKKNYEDFAYLWCVATMIRTAVIWSRGLDEGDRIHFVFDRQKGLQGRADAVSAEVVDITADIDADIRGPQFESSDRLAPLQAADVLAYETYKELFNRINLADRHDPRKSLRYLLNNRFHVGYYFEKSEIEHAIAIARGHKQPSSEPVPYEPPILYDSDASTKVRAPRSQPYLHEVSAE